MLKILSKIYKIGIVTETLPVAVEPALEAIGAQLKAQPCRAALGLLQGEAAHNLCGLTERLNAG